MPTTLTPTHLLVDEEQRAAVTHTAEALHRHPLHSVVGFTETGQKVSFDPEVAVLLGQILEALKQHGHVQIGTLPEELTSSTAAQLLGISRPTLLKKAQAKELPSFKVGTHTRFNRDAVLAFKRERERQRKSALEEILDLGEELDAQP
ncbi:helix-turn-helix domain-containing protein [Rothia kristinae]|uniref:Helix-turn-helix domain-containing protein n=1 Tax=Rothia kristinae TaxID=37923 RepID=A0A7T4MRY9_9MICC|nr:helix-turn-helix domain-containing protein [Rothia kristinae]QQC58567.1 helix-turn-helix domain-containing protein [Rothia kristinae]